MMILVVQQPVRTWATVFESYLIPYFPKSVREGFLGSPWESMLLGNTVSDFTQGCSLSVPEEHKQSPLTLL